MERDSEKERKNKEGTKRDRRHALPFFPSLPLTGACRSTMKFKTFTGCVSPFLRLLLGSLILLPSVRLAFFVLFMVLSGEEWPDEEHTRRHLARPVFLSFFLPFLLSPSLPPCLPRGAVAAATLAGN